jgi:hypothetical protein
MYKLLTVKGMFGDEQQHIIRNDGNNSFTSFPVDEDNRDYKEYLEWVAAGNTPEPADE